MVVYSTLRGRVSECSARGQEFGARAVKPFGSSPGIEECTSFEDRAVLRLDVGEMDLGSFSLCRARLTHFATQTVVATDSVFSIGTFMQVLDAIEARLCGL